VLHELRNQKAAGSPADTRQNCSRGASCAECRRAGSRQAAPTEQLSAGKLRALAEQLGQLKADAERMADAMEAKGAAKTAAGAKPASKADANVVLAVMTPDGVAGSGAGAHARVGVSCRSRTLSRFEGVPIRSYLRDTPVTPGDGLIGSTLTLDIPGAFRTYAISSGTEV
jgi:hypothetical protein